jgi:chemotaxis protein methyltransferase CheR
MKQQRAMANATPEEIREVEIDLLLEGVFRIFGYDFRQYSRRSVRRRLTDLAREESLKSISSLQEKVFRNEDTLNRLISALAVQVSHLFRDPAFFLAFRRTAIPLLRTYPSIRIWHAGCSTGEEVYSMAILLKEEGVFERSRIYATDINDASLAIARHGEYTASEIKDTEENYIRAGGKRSLRDYFAIEGNKAVVDSSLRKNMMFTRHNLVTDGSFNEFHAILCRNVLIYFTQELAERVHELLFHSLVRFGILALGAKESLQFLAREKSYRALDEEARLYRRVH